MTTQTVDTHVVEQFKESFGAVNNELAEKFDVMLSDDNGLAGVVDSDREQFHDLNIAGADLNVERAVECVYADWKMGKDEIQCVSVSLDGDRNANWQTKGGLYFHADKLEQVADYTGHDSVEAVLSAAQSAGNELIVDDMDGETTVILVPFTLPNNRRSGRLEEQAELPLPE